MKHKPWLFVFIIVAAVAVWRLPLWFSQPSWPPTAWRSFSEWGDAWILSPRSSGWYMIYLAYYKWDGGRLDAPKKRTAIHLKVIDESTGEAMPLYRDWEYGQLGPNKDWQIEEVGNIPLIKGHRYRVEVDPEQLKELSRYRHRLGVDLDVSEKIKWSKRRDYMERVERLARIIHRIVADL